MYKHAAILVAQGVQDEEFIYPYYRFLEEEFTLDTVFVSTEKYKTPEGKYGIPFKPTYDLNYSLKEDIDKFADKYDILLIPGGWQCPEILRMNKSVISLTQKMAEKNKVIAAICHGPQVLISAGLCAGRQITGFQGIWDDLKYAGSFDYDKASVIVHNNFVSAQHYRDNPKFMKAILKTYFEHYVPKVYQS